MKRRTRWMDPATRATVDVIRAAAAPGVQPDAVREGLRAALEADGMTGHALEAAMRDADAVLALGREAEDEEGRDAMNRQQKRASARSASKRDTAEGMAAVAMAARVAALSPEGREIAYETATGAPVDHGLSPAERAGAERRLAIIRALVDSIDDAKRGAL
jgi:hypothetical protein